MFSLECLMENASLLNGSESNFKMAVSTIKDANASTQNVDSKDKKSNKDKKDKKDKKNKKDKKS